MGDGLAEFAGWQRALAEAVAEGGGTVTVRLIDIRETPALLEAVRHQGIGNRELRDLSAVGELLEVARTLSRERAPRCLVCRKPLVGKRHVASCMLLRAARDDPDAIFALGVCESCVRTAGGHRQLWPIIIPILREASPGLRDISPQIVDVIGHA